MNTAPLQNSANLLAAPPAGPRAAAAETPFNQLLSREVAQRNDAAAPASPATAPTPNAAADAPGQRTDSRTAETGNDDASETAEHGDDGATVTPISAELLALVAGLQRGTCQPEAADSANATDIDAQALDTRLSALTGKKGGTRAELAAEGEADTDAGLGRTPALANGKAAPVATADTRAAAEPKTAAQKDGGFEAVQKQVAEALPAADASPARPAESAPLMAAAPLAPATLQAVAHTAASAAGDKLTPQVGTPAWDSALGQKVVWMVAGGQQSAALTLNPPDLGPLQVVLHVNNSHANATFVSAQPEVRQALEAAMPRLREMLGDAGIQLGQANVGADMPGQQQAAAEQSARQSGRGADGAIGALDGSARAPRAAAVSAAGRGLVDTFA